MMNIRSLIKISLLVFILVGGAIQLLPVQRTNPPGETEVPASAEIRTILRQACYDCHSNETVWPWYSRVAPISWLVAYDVREGREEMNFSTWNRYSSEQKADKLKEIIEVVSEGEMPPRIYLPLHPEARLSAEAVAALRAWSESVPAQEKSPS